MRIKQIQFYAGIKKIIFFLNGWFILLKNHSEKIQTFLLK